MVAKWPPIKILNASLHLQNFQLFEGVHLLIRTIQDRTEEIILNMNPVRSHVLAILGPQFEKIYASSWEGAECGLEIPL